MLYYCKTKHTHQKCLHSEILIWRKCNMETPNLIQYQHYTYIIIFRSQKQYYSHFPSVYLNKYETYHVHCPSSLLEIIIRVSMFISIIISFIILQSFSIWLQSVHAGQRFRSATFVWRCVRLWYRKSTFHSPILQMCL